MKLEIFNNYLEQIENTENRNKLQQVLEWVSVTFPELVPRIAWNQPMFTHHGTYIIGFSVSKSHMAVSPEREGIVNFIDEIDNSGYKASKMLFRIKWNDEVDHSLLKKIIEFTIEDKANCSTFWRK